jgi:hypothetical protein
MITPFDTSPTEQSEVEYLRAEVTRLQLLLEAKFDKETLLTGMQGNQLQLQGGAASLLAEMFALQFEEGKADNYLEVRFTSAQIRPGEEFVVTVQKVAGKTPHQLRIDAETLCEAMSKREQASYQRRVQPWLMECFGPMIADDTEERNHRFLEEAVELVQACGCTRSEAHQLVDYVFDRPVGESPQEVGGVMITLAALCLAQKMDMHECGETELARVWTMVEKIRAKQAAKPKHSPLAQHVGNEGAQ